MTRSWTTPETAEITWSTPLPANDARLIQRVVGHVLESQAAGALPCLPWHTGLAVADRQAVRTRWPASSARWDSLDLHTPPAHHLDLLQRLRDLLVAHRATDDPVATVLANALSSACFGGRHLWQDLGASGREDVSRLLSLGFPSLHDSNRRHLRWKRHLFLVLGEGLGRGDLRPPKCDACSDYAMCFGSPAPAATTTWPQTPIR
jgi:nitrogen fixation protein NifQ